MEDKQLDNIIGKKLEDFEMSYQPSSWDALVDRLNDADATENFDESIRRKLSDIELSYQPLYWDMLAQRLDRESTFRKQLLQYKATEILLVLLILITFVHIFPNQTIKNVFSFSEDETFEWNSSKDDLSADLHENIIHYNELANLTTETPSLSTMASETRRTDRSSKIYVYADDRNTVTEDMIGVSLTPLLKSSTPLLSIPSSSIQYPSHGVVLEGSSTVVTKLIAVQPIALLREKTIDLPKEEKARRRWYISMIGSSNIDYIQTPYDEILNKAPISRYDLGGYSGGVLFGKEWKRWGLETGLIYSHKKYKPTNARLAYYGNITEGYNVEGLKDIELNTIQLPINIRYDIVQQPKWHFYTLGGISMNVAIVANYDVGKVSARALNVSSSIVNGEVLELSERQQELFDEKSVPSEPESSVLKQRKFSNGIFNGGSYKENSFYTANLGFGMERHLDERLSIFFQPTYRQHLTILNKGIGPNEDRISTLNVLIGAKIGF